MQCAFTILHKLPLKFVLVKVECAFASHRLLPSTVYRCLMGSTDQADPSCFYFRISWILTINDMENKLLVRYVTKILDFNFFVQITYFFMRNLNFWSRIVILIIWRSQCSRFLRPCIKWRGRKKKSTSFHQNSWNSEVETTWISLIGWHHKTSTK